LWLRPGAVKGFAEVFTIPAAQVTVGRILTTVVGGKIVRQFTP